MDFSICIYCVLGHIHPPKLPHFHTLLYSIYFEEFFFLFLFSIPAHMFKKKIYTMLRVLYVSSSSIHFPEADMVHSLWLGKTLLHIWYIYHSPVWVPTLIP